MKGHDINWNQVAYFSEVATSGSLKDAAEKLGVSSSTLSEQIAQLEKNLAVQLFFRQHRKLALTAEGAKLYRYAREMFEVGKRLIDTVSPIALGCYPVSVGLVPNLSLQRAYDFIGDYCSAFGPLDMKFVHTKHDQLERNLRDAVLDFGFSDLPSERKNLVSTVVLSSNLNFYVSPKLAEDSFTKLVQRLPLLLCKPEPATRSMVEHFLEENELRPASVISSDYPGLLVELCQKGLGIGVFSEDTTRHEDTEFRRLRKPQNSPKLAHRLYAIWSKDGENAASVKHLKTLITHRGENRGAT